MAWIYVVRPVRPGLLVGQLTEEEAAGMQEHLAYLGRLRDEGTLVLAGPSVTPDDTFGIVILDSVDEDQAREIMEDDPAVRGGYLTAELRRFTIAVR